jgi:hypothetical protein
VRLYFTESVAGSGARQAAAHPVQPDHEDVFFEGTRETTDDFQKRFWNNQKRFC